MKIRCVAGRPEASPTTRSETVGERGEKRATAAHLRAIQGQLEHICRSPAHHYLKPALIQPQRTEDTLARVRSEHFAHLPHGVPELDATSTQWRNFAGSWADLSVDTFMADGGSYRQRRYSVLRCFEPSAPVEVLSAMPLYQAPTYNTLNGGTLRDYPVIPDSVLDSECFHLVLSHALEVFTRREAEEGQSSCRWFIEVDQFRITASQSQAGLPTPEGIHHDGGDGIVMMLIDRHHVDGGQTTLYDMEKNPLFTRTLETAGESFFVSDRHMLHGVTPVTPKPGAVAGTRDLMVIAMANLDRPGSIARRFGASPDLSLSSYPIV